MVNKFKFTTEFQYDLLKYTVTDSNGYKALEMYDDKYFTLVEHSIIAYTLKKYYSRKRRIPGKTIFIEELLKVFESRDFAGLLTDDDRKNIRVLADNLYNGAVKDGDEILANTERFAQFVDLKDVIESVNLIDYNQYNDFSRKIQKAISPRVKSITERGSFLIKDVSDRQVRRTEFSQIIKTPFSQINQTTNAGGYSKNSILVVLDKAKRFKSGMLINIAKGYLKMGKNVLVIDLDNGEGELMIRVEQSIVGLTKLQMLSGEYDEMVAKKLSKYKGEIVIKRFPALVTTSKDIQAYMNYLYNEFGLKFQVLVIDYIAKMGCISGKESLHERISEAYIDIGNLGLEEDIEHIWTAQHVTRDAARKRMATRYDSTDVAGAIDITRHVQAIFGLNRTTEEDNKGIQRMEIVDQRDGKPKGRAIFHINRELQRVTQFTKTEIDDYYREYKDLMKRVDEMEIEDDDAPVKKKAEGYSRVKPKSDTEADA